MMSITADAPVGSFVAMPRLKAHQVTGVSPTGNYETLCGKVVPPSAQQADDSNVCANCKRLNAAQESPQTESETPAQEAAPEPARTYAGAWFVESFTPGRFAGWFTEAGGFDTEQEAHNWLAVNRDKLIHPNHKTRVIQEDGPAPVAPRPEPVNRDMPVLADKLVLPDADALARETDPDNVNPHKRLAVLEIGKDKIPSGPARKTSGREPRFGQTLPERQAFVTPIGSRLNDPGNQVGGTATTSPDRVIGRVDGTAFLPIGETGMAGVRPDPEIMYADIVGGKYGEYTRAELNAKLEGLPRANRQTIRRRNRRRIAANKASGHVPLAGSRKVVPIESVRGAK